MTTAFVLSGGANLGAVQVGMLKALNEADIRPDLLIGTSVGAINAAWLSGAPKGDDLDELVEIWCSLRRNDIFPLRLGMGLAGFLGKRESLTDASGLRELIESNIRFDRLEDAPIPLHVVVTDVLDGHDIALSEGSASEVITASAAIPGIFPTVEIDGRAYMDGGVVNNAPVSYAVEFGADVVYVLSTGYACSLTEPPSSALGMTLHAVTLMINSRLSDDVDRYIDEVDLRVVPPPCPMTVGPGDFGHADELIEGSYQSTVDWLGSDRGERDRNPLVHHHAQTRNLWESGR